ncbi:hypothetical protein BDQ12DRAFT_673669 [Crucibulum laeve]|uniref:Arrestin-like N-terminal domain-containing protein n=1 Tax=Crucibulum laeve TaxID=68775 RepID=A0A5C3MHJ2_9AGAR|nr:hypothetical protein BDQ12DRAFT_673669 [Crucibulum laeve]
MSELLTPSPPVYSLPSCVPSYSSLPLANEETVQYTPRQGTTSNPHGTFVRKWPQATLILKDQDPSSRLPSYGRHGVVCGELGLTNPEKVVEVTLKLAGRMSCILSDDGTVLTPVVSESVILWKADSPEAPKNHRCPTSMPFILRFPQTFQTEGKSWSIPPSFEATFLGIPALFVRCTYTLSIEITKTRQSRLTLWPASKTYITLLHYRPRTRPNRPIFRCDSIFRSIKPVPEEWLQLVSTMNVRPKSKLKPIDCHFVVPSIQAYALTDSIPFHIQLCSSLASLRELLPSTSVLLKPPVSGGDGIKWITDDRPGDTVIRVYIARQVVLEMNSKRRFRTLVIGNAKLKPVPPLVTKSQDTLSSDEVHIDWEGEVRCRSEVSCGGFSVGGLIVKDFLVLSLTPSSPRSSPLLPLQLAHPIKLVTDSWDDDLLHPHDT